jgi:hypothetical protein
LLRDLWFGERTPSEAENPDRRVLWPRGAEFAKPPPQRCEARIGLTLGHHVEALQHEPTSVEAIYRLMVVAAGFPEGLPRTVLTCREYAETAAYAALPATPTQDIAGL